MIAEKEVSEAMDQLEEAFFRAGKIEDKQTDTLTTWWNTERAPGSRSAQEESPGDAT